jgi:hypothetical protein
LQAARRAYERSIAFKHAYKLNSNLSLAKDALIALAEQRAASPVGETAAPKIELAAEKFCDKSFRFGGKS